MFEIGFPELVLVCVIALLVLGPERMPEALRTLGLWVGRLRRNFLSVKSEIEREIGMDEVRRQLHNETILEDIKRLEREVKTDRAVPGRTAADPTAASAPSIDAPKESATPTGPAPTTQMAPERDGTPS